MNAAQRATDGENNNSHKFFSSLYLQGSLPLPWDVPRLVKEFNIGAVVNMTIEYSGPLEQYALHGVKQLRLPTVDTAAPTLEQVFTCIAIVFSSGLFRIISILLLLFSHFTRSLQVHPRRVAWHLSEGSSKPTPGNESSSTAKAHPPSLPPLPPSLPPSLPRSTKAWPS